MTRNELALRACPFDAPSHEFFVADARLICRKCGEVRDIWRTSDDPPGNITITRNASTMSAGTIPPQSYMADGTR